MSVNKKEISDMVYKLSDRDLHLVSDLIYRLIDNSPNLDSHIPFDDEPLSEDDLRAIKEAEKEFREGRTIKFEDVKNELLQD